MTRRWFPLVIGLAAAALFVRLGVWQLHRLAERRAGNAVLARALADTVRVTGRFDFTGDSVVANRMFEGIPGVYVYTPLVTAAGRQMVLRGFVPSPDARTVNRERLRERDSTAVTGYRIPATGDTVVWRLVLPAHAPEHMVPVPPPAISNGPHLSYAIQWFAFAVIAIVGAVVIVRRA